MAEAHKSNPNHKSDSLGSLGPELSNKTTIKTDTRTNSKLAELAGVMKFTYIKVDIQTIKMVT